MRVSLINPPITTEERYGSGIGAAGGRQAPLGICYLAAVLEKEGIAVQIIDAEAEGLDYDKVVCRVKNFGTDIVGITSTTTAFHRALALGRSIKDYDSELCVVLGGPHVTALPKHAMSFDCFDVGVLKEGEMTLLELCSVLEQGKDLGDVKGIVYKKNSKTLFTDQREYIPDLDTLPFPARHLLPNIHLYTPPPMDYRNLPVVNLVTSRGCPNQCIFCDNNVFGRKYRAHSPEYVVSEIKHVMEKFGARELAFVDDTFTIDKKRVERIIELMSKEKIDVEWTCMVRANNLTRELLNKMKDAGCWHISLGIESGNQGVLDFIKKGIKLDQVRNVVKWADEIGIHTKGFFMLGHPVDTKKTIRETIDFAKSIPLDEAVVTIVTPIPNTELYNIANDYGRLDTTDWSKFSYWHPVFIPEGLTEEYLKSAQNRFYWEFYSRPSNIIRHMMQVNSRDNLKRWLRGVKAVLSIGLKRERRGN